MAFTDKYRVQPLPAVVRNVATAQLSPQDRARSKLLTALEIQHKLLAAELKGQTYMTTRNGKQMAPRAFWLKTPVGVAFTPRFGTQFLFEKGQGGPVLHLDSGREMGVKKVVAKFCAIPTPFRDHQFGEIN